MFFNTFSPAFYIEYFRILAERGEVGRQGVEMVMGRFATVQAGEGFKGEE